MIQQTLPKIPVSEAVILRQILTWLRLNRIFCWRCNNIGVYDPTMKRYRTPSFGAMKGVSDIIGIYRGKPLAIEVKSSSGRLSIEQQEFLRLFKEQGGIAIVARSISDVELALASA